MRQPRTATKPARDSKGRFKRQRGWHLNKGYPRFSSGPHRGKYVHRVVMERRLRRPLAHDEDVHHRDRNKQNFHHSNLTVLGHREHGCVSARQHFWLKKLDIKLKEEWDGWFDEHAGTQV